MPLESVMVTFSLLCKARMGGGDKEAKMEWLVVFRGVTGEFSVEDDDTTSIIILASGSDMIRRSGAPASAAVAMIVVNEKDLLLRNNNKGGFRLVSSTLCLCTSKPSPKGDVSFLAL